MNGLLEKGMASQPAAAQPTTAPAATQEPAGSSQPPDQKEIDIFVANGIKIVHNPKASDQLISQIVKAAKPVEAIADATIIIVGKLEQSATAAGKKPSLTTLAYGANVIMGEIITSAEAAGMPKLNDEQKYMAFSLAVGKYLEDAVKTGKMTEEEVIQLGKEAEATPLGQKMAAGETEAPVPGAEKPAAPPATPPANPGLIGGV
jgi:hypothetical protein